MYFFQWIKIGTKKLDKTRRITYEVPNFAQNELYLGKVKFWSKMTIGAIISKLFVVIILIM